MNKILGQDNLLNKLNNYDLNNFPRSLLLVGDRGSGKHLISNYIKENILNLPLIDITEIISSEVIDNIYINPNPSIYLINLSDITEKSQNILLKFIEEPLSNAYIILLCESKLNVLNTILNRCVTIELELYTKDILSNFISNNENKELILNVLKTPGDIINSNLSNIEELYDLCIKICDKINSANILNSLSICDKINYKDEYSKFDLNLFLDVLAYSLNKYYKETLCLKYLNMYLILIENRKKLIDKRINKRLFMESLIIKLWKGSRDNGYNSIKI